MTPPLHSRVDAPRRQAVDRRRPRAPFWTPWLCAPLFAGLPIVGCGLATPAVDSPRAVSGESFREDHAAARLAGGRQPSVVPIGAILPVRTVVR